MNSNQLYNPMRLSGFIALFSVLAGISAAPAPAWATPEEGTVDLLATPPELTTTVDPNIVLTFDDSGSMMATSMPDSISSSNSSQYYFSARTNLIYFDPTKTYPPPLKADGTSFPNSSYTNAWRDGLCANAPGSYCYSSSNRVNLSTSFYSKFVKPTNAADTPNHLTGTDISTTIRGGNSGDYNGGFYFNCPTVGSNTGCVRVLVNTQSAEVKQAFANWYSYYRTRNLLSRTALTRAFGLINGDVRVAWQTINSDYEHPYSVGNPALANRAIDKLVGTWRDNFYNWIYDVKTTGSTPNRRAMIQAGRFFERELTQNTMNPYWQPDAVTGVGGRNLSCRKNFHMLVTDGYWNDNTTALSPVAPTGYFDGQTNRTLPDSREFSNADAQSRVIWDVRGAKVSLSMANIAFYYWAKDLQPDLINNVNPYLPDKTTGVTGAAVSEIGNAALDNKEIYFNPANNPASWQHLSQFMITLGVAGTLNFPSDLLKLRKGEDVSANTKGWPTPSNNSAAGVDDTWHAAVNSRGAYFSASNPSELVQHLSDVLATILAQSASSTSMTVSLPLITDGTSGYTAGYDTSDWSGSLMRNSIDAETAEATDIKWNAACILTGGTCPGTGAATARDPDSRVIITSDGLPGTGKPFRWSSLSTAQKAKLNINPSTINLSQGTWIADTYGEQRVGYLRGDRTHESTATPRFRSRGSVMGAVIKGEPVYVSSPISGHRDIFPDDESAPGYGGETSYAQFQYDNRSRAPTVYVAANDGMLHAFDAATGVERWAYVPNALIDNLQLVKSTQNGIGLVPTMDDKPQQLDVFFDEKWRTVLVGSMRLGARGVYAIDVSNPELTTETAAATAVPMWEFTNVAPESNAGEDCAVGARFCSSLGYTYESVNIARLANGKWGALVSSGYFPEDENDPASAASRRKATSLLVIDVETGTLIKEIRTDEKAEELGATTYGLSQSIVYDYGSDQIADIAVAGDLAGNLWRFDISSDDPDDWRVDLMFRTYGDGTGNEVGDQPIAIAPISMRGANRKPVFIFGTGKFLGKPDRTSQIPEQAFYGIGDLGAQSDEYPIIASGASLVTYKLTQANNGVRSMAVTNSPLDPSDVRGWRIPLDLSEEPGERAQRTAFPLYSSNVALLYSLIPKTDDPCDPGNRYAVMGVNASTGAPAFASGDNNEVGAAFSTSTPPGTPVTRTGGGAGSILIPGLPPAMSDEVGAAVKFYDDVWHRGAWRELLNFL
jgi:type IV pilus assembly protein PilY1